MIKHYLNIYTGVHLNMYLPKPGSIVLMAPLSFRKSITDAMVHSNDLFEVDIDETAEDIHQEILDKLDPYIEAMPVNYLRKFSTLGITLTNTWVYNSATKGYVLEEVLPNTPLKELTSHHYLYEVIDLAANRVCKWSLGANIIRLYEP